MLFWRLLIRLVCMSFLSLVVSPRFGGLIDFFLTGSFLAAKASTGKAAWPLVQADIKWAMGQDALQGKKIILDEVRLSHVAFFFLSSTADSCTQNAWPSSTGSGVKANSRHAVASVAQEHVSTRYLSLPHYH